MDSVRTPAVAGQFYPGTARELETAVRGYLSKVKASPGPVPKALVAPHAGYIYSGAVAASAYARLIPAADTIRRVVLLGPCHRVAVLGLATSSADAFATPLGTVPIDHAAIESIRHLPQVSVFDATHAQEHSLEVHLPFLQVVLKDFALVPLVVGDASDDEVAQVMEALWGGPETLIVVSSDLSHYEDYVTARRLDAATAKAIETLDPDAIGRDHACGRIPLRGLLALAERRGMKVATVDLRNSGDTAGSRERVVGYGSWIFTEAGAHAAEDAFGQRTRDLLRDHGQALLHLAAASIENGLANARPLAVALEAQPLPLRNFGACFVTLKTEGRLRGCIGSPAARRPLATDVAENAFAAAFKDPRFPALSDQELPQLKLSISVLSAQSAMTFADERDLLAQLRPGIDGLVIADGGRRALFLPSVWEQLPDPRAFLTHLKQKAGMAADHWSDRFVARRFVAEERSADDLPDPAAIWRRGRPVQ